MYFPTKMYQLWSRERAKKVKNKAKYSIVSDYPPKLACSSFPCCRHFLSACSFSLNRHSSTSTFLSLMLRAFLYFAIYFSCSCSLSFNCSISLSSCSGFSQTLSKGRVILLTYPESFRLPVFELWRETALLWFPYRTKPSLLIEVSCELV